MASWNKAGIPGRAAFPLYLSYPEREQTDSVFPTLANSGSALTSQAPRSVANSAAKASA